MSFCQKFGFRYGPLGFAEKFPYRTKAVFAFEVIDGTEVCFFGLHVREYGSNCPPPNQRCGCFVFGVLRSFLSQFLCSFFEKYVISKSFSPANYVGFFQACLHCIFGFG